MGATIRDVAQHAGVSIATVSRVLRGTATVAPQTRDRVVAAVDELRFTPSHLGRQLAERRHAANGIVFPDLSGPYFAEVVLGYEAAAAELGRSVLILSTHGRDAAPSMVEEMASRCDGLVILGRTVPDDVVQRLAARGVPIVLLARPPIGDIDSVEAENIRAAGELARLVLDCGARHLVFVGDPAAAPDVSQRWEGVRQVAADDPGVRLDLEPASGFGEQDGAEVARREVAAGTLPDAFICANDELALGLMVELKDAGVDVPGQVLVTGWDDVMAARYAGLTTVRQPMRDLGAIAARLLDERITSRRETPRREVLPTQLVIRSSCDPSRKESR